MPVPCPHCQQAIIPGNRFCAACGASLLIEATPGRMEPVCALHPGMRSLGACERCGAFTCARCLRLGALGGGVCEHCYEREQAVPLPWDCRADLGIFKAFWKTCIEVLLRPGLSFTGRRARGSVGSSLLFSLLCVFCSSVGVGLTYVGLGFFAFQVMPWPEGFTMHDGAFGAFLLVMGVLWLVVVPLMGLVHTFITAGMDHLVLRLAGVSRGFEVTLRANALSQAPYAFGLIPMVGLYVAPFWALVARAFGYRGLHQTRWGTAVMGALAAPVLFVLFCCGGQFVLLLLSSVG